MPNYDAPVAVAARFEDFDAHHGPIEGSLKDAILSSIFEKIINRYFDYSQSKPLGAYVQNEMKRLAPEVLSILELAQEWTTSPMDAARHQLRQDLEAKAETERQEREQRQEAEIRAEVRRKTEEILADLKVLQEPLRASK